MYFSTYDPYDERYDIFLRDIIQREDHEFNKNNENNENDGNKECIICWEPSAILNEVNCLQVTTIIHIPCQCNVYIHDKCLRVWIKSNHSCPICRVPTDLLDVSFSEVSENIFRVWYIFLHEYKNIFHIIFFYLLFLQISIIYFLVVDQTTYDEISDTV
jgi:hypothetical protein